LGGDRRGVGSAATTAATTAAAIGAAVEVIVWGANPSVLCSATKRGIENDSLCGRPLLRLGRAKVAVDNATRAKME